MTVISSTGFCICSFQDFTFKFPNQVICQAFLFWYFNEFYNFKHDSICTGQPTTLTSLEGWFTWKGTETLGCCSNRWMCPQNGCWSRFICWLRHRFCWSWNIQLWPWLPVFSLVILCGITSTISMGGPASTNKTDSHGPIAVRIQRTLFPWADHDRLQQMLGLLWRQNTDETKITMVNNCSDWAMAIRYVCTNKSLHL